MLRRLNKVLPELVAAIIIYGLAAWLAGIWFVRDKLMFSTGLFIGICLAVGMAVHMAVVLEDAVSAGSSQSKLVAMSLLRYVAVVLVFFCTVYFKASGKAEYISVYCPERDFIRGSCGAGRLSAGSLHHDHHLPDLLYDNVRGRNQL